ncbi:MAG: magnesium transporter, partial [Eubacterium sp.]|nr:magnesium transporter [Candidatus Colimonas fimequi]
MTREVLKEPIFAEEIVEIIRSNLTAAELVELLEDFHDNDIAQSLELLERDERIKLYRILGSGWISEIFSYIDEPERYVDEMGIETLAEIINEMDSDDAVDLLEKLDKDTVVALRPFFTETVKADIKLITSYDEDEIGSLITTKFIRISDGLSVSQATREMIRQAGDNDNISTIYVNDKEGKFVGAIELQDLITARRSDELDSLISTSYPFLRDHDIISENIERIKDYAEDSLPVLNSRNEILGIITSQDIIEAVDDELGDDYAKLAGLTSEEDLRETTMKSMKKRLPWLIALLFLGMGVS